MNEIISYFAEHPYRIWFVVMPLVVVLSYLHRKAYYSNSKKNIRLYRVVHIITSIVLLFMVTCAIIYVWC